MLGLGGHSHATVVATYIINELPLLYLYSSRTRQLCNSNFDSETAGDGLQ